MSDSTFQVYSLLPPEDVKRLGGIPPEAVIGLVIPEILAQGRAHFTPDTFKPNSVFREFLHKTLARCVLDSPGIRAEARRIGNGWVYLIDGRIPNPQGHVPPHDIVGFVEAKDGEIAPGAYQPNPKHRIVSEDGLFQLPPELEQCLLKAMRNLPRAVSS